MCGKHSLITQNKSNPVSVIPIQNCFFYSICNILFCGKIYDLYRLFSTSHLFCFSYALVPLADNFLMKPLYVIASVFLIGFYFLLIGVSSANTRRGLFNQVTICQLFDCFNRPFVAFPKEYFVFSFLENSYRQISVVINVTDITDLYKPWD